MIWLLATAVVLVGSLSLAGGRGGAVLFPVFVVLVGVTVTDLMGVPRPEWTGDLDNELVIAADFQPGEAIYVWVRGDPPVAYSLPWDEELAKEIQEGLRAAEGAGEPGIRMQRLEEGYSIEEGNDAPPAGAAPKT